MTKKQNSNYLFLLLLLGAVAFALWQSRRNNSSQPADLPEVPGTGAKALFFGDRLLAPTHLGDPGDFARQILQGLGLNGEVSLARTAFQSTDGMISQLEEVLAEKPNIVFLSLGAAALESREDLGTTVSHLKTMGQRFRDQGILAVFLGINPPGVGDNWSMALGHAFKEARLLCIDDIFGGQYQGSSPGEWNLSPEAYQTAVDKIVQTVKPHMGSPEKS